MRNTVVDMDYAQDCVCMLTLRSLSCCTNERSNGMVDTDRVSANTNASIGRLC